MNRCKKCGQLVTNGKCCEFSAADEEFKSAVKEQYFELAADYASKGGLANFIWRKFIDATKSEQKAWQEKQKSIANMASNYSNKYEPIIEQKDKDIEYLQNLVKNLQSRLPNDELNSDGLVKSIMACGGCGSTTGCYCR